MHNAEETEIIFARVNEVLEGIRLSPSSTSIEHTVAYKKLLDAISQLRQERDASQKDEATGLSRFEHFIKDLGEEIGRRRSRKSMQHDTGDCTVVFCDINNFKKINDRTTHLTGDAIVRVVSEILSNSFIKHSEDNPVDFVARSYRGGDEFMVCYKGNEKEARSIMNGINDALGKKKFITSKEPKYIIENLSLKFGCYKLDSLQPSEQYTNIAFKQLPPDKRQLILDQYGAKFAIDTADERMKTAGQKMKKKAGYKEVSIRKATEKEKENPEKYGLSVLTVLNSNDIEHDSPGMSL